MMRGAALLLILLAPSLTGCLDFLPDSLTRPDYQVSRTAVATGPGAWNTGGVFVVQVNELEPVEVTIRARPVPTGVARSTAGFSDVDTAVSLAIPDGTWTISYTVDGHDWETFKEARFDATPPDLTGLETLASAPSGSYVLGEGAVVESGAQVKVIRQATGAQVATSLPVTFTGLADGVHAFDVVVSDAAGNKAVWTVQVVAGTATQLPDGAFTMGIVARYTTSAAVWDITDLDAYLMPEVARQQAPQYLGSGVGITPQDPAVKDFVAAAGVTSDMTTAEAALALYRWMFDELEYDEARLEENNLLDPAETIAADGGVCRDLAGLYVSLLRSAGIPARLVAGYLGGRVGGFHAWVEFYGGAGQGPSEWVPVDVSGIGLTSRSDDDQYSEVAMFQAFGVRLPEYLMLRAVTPAQEQEDWSSAMSLSYSTPPATPTPEAPFDKSLDDVAVVEGVLCVNQQTRFRELRSSSVQCTTPQRGHIPDFITGATRVLDYGVRVESSSRGTTLTLEIVYPDTEDNNADRVEFAYYAPRTSDGCEPDAQAGRATCVMKV